jgi:hypothetical protein
MKDTGFNLGRLEEKRGHGCTNRDANSHTTRYLLTAINMIFMDKEQR